MSKNIIGAHAILYSRKPEADREFFRDVLKLSHVDIGEGWLIFGLPPSELAVHPSSRNKQELYFMCSNVEALAASMEKNGIRCSAIQALSWGKRTQITLPGGGKLGVYQPLHKRPRGAAPRRLASSKSRTRKKG